MALIQAHGDRSKTHRQQNPSHIGQGKAPKLEGFTIIYGRNISDEWIYTEPSKVVRPIETATKQGHQMGLKTEHDQAFEEIKKNDTKNN